MPTLPKLDDTDRKILRALRADGRLTNLKLAETVGSMASYLCIDASKFYCVGLEINANHLRGLRSGRVTAVARAIHIGRTTHVWSIELRDENGKLTCNCSLTMAILAPEAAKNVRLDQASVGGVQ